MKFETWLREQKDRDDIIGDLAKDYIRALACDMRAPFSRRFKGVDNFNIEETMAKWSASQEAFEALAEAKQEWGDCIGGSVVRAEVFGG